MKLLVFLGVAAAAVLLLSPLSDRGPGEGSGAARTSSVTVGTFNIHYISSSQSSMRWESRRDAVVRALRDGNADIVAFQEMETFEGGHWSGENRQLDWVRGRFPEYAVAAVGNPMSFPSTQPILFRRERFDRLDQGFFSFSPTPDVPYARPWKRSFPSFCSWVLLRDLRSDGRLYVYNVHFDAFRPGNRIRSARLVASRVRHRDQSDASVVVLGDFNAPRYFDAVGVLRESGLTVSPSAGSTYHFGLGLNILPAIDHVLFSSGLSHMETRVLRRRYGGVWPADHYPVIVRLEPDPGPATNQGSRSAVEGADR